MSESSEPTFINGLNRSAIQATKANMRADASMAANVPIVIEAVWEKGVVRETSGCQQMVCHPPPQIAKTIDYPSMNSYCPLVSVGCFCLVFMMEAAERKMQLDSFEASVLVDADMSGFYKMGVMNANPWNEGVKVDLRIQAPYTKEQLDDLVEFAHANCPSVEIMRRSFPVEVRMEPVMVQDDVDKDEVYYDLDKYHRRAAQPGELFVKQGTDMTWFCHNESEEFPDALMLFDFTTDGGSKLPLSYGGPIGPGKYSNPVQACFFGGLSAHMHTVALRLNLLGYIVKRIQGSMKAQMNSRRVFAVDLDTYIFPSGATIDLIIESNAPEDVMDQVQFEAEQMSPSFMNWTNSIPIDINVVMEP